MHSGLESRSTELHTGPSAPLSSGAMGAQTQLPFVMKPVRLQTCGTKSVQTKLPFVKVNNHQDTSSMRSNKDETSKVIVASPPMSDTIPVPYATNASLFRDIICPMGGTYDRLALDHP